jgi:prevent-host-death family protein
MLYTATLPLTDARSRFSEIIESAAKLYKRFSITLRGKPAAVVISQQEYDELVETANVLADKELMKSLKKAKNDIEAGRVMSVSDLKKKLNV